MFVTRAITAVAALLCIFQPANAQPKPQPPNILVIIADDCTYSDLSFHGGENSRTPHLDRLASQGMVFDRAYLSMAMCAPSRSELYTGRFPLRNGCAWNHAPAREGTRSITHHLGEQGYRVGLAGKSHVNPASVFAFEDVPGFDGNCVRNPTRPHDLAGVRSFTTRKPDQPFCLVVALTEPHVPWVMGDASAYPPASIKLPPNLADTPRTREAFSSYLAEITYMDGQVGELLRLLDDTGLEENTLVLFTSEQGAQFPGHKWTNWDSGLHTSLVARLPGSIAAGSRTPAVVQYADVVPTLIDLAGAKPDNAAFDGTSFLPVLKGTANRHRDRAYGLHNNYPEGPPYPIRSITDGDWRYIRNLRPDRTYIEKHLMGLENNYWGSWLSHSTERPAILHLVERYLHRPAEELYHTAADRFELANLAADPAHAETKARLSAALDLSMVDQRDPGASLDTPEAFKAAESGKPAFPGKP
ncbi:sulfatase [Luteolibacter sp. SL250]|uniref:sulfatase family protein n=1 Tax=Luteolibacter sp. SL250 TaxID=2995170 RepID=UPI00226F0449|nr:sulfatase [Luteolibacter sp. SL250]WAC19604.1 sulfatase [Luteolibacter sp. SL250]